MKYIDLHVHSTASDGSVRPSELVNKAIAKNLSAFALTDHDTVDGIDEAINEASKINSVSDSEIIKVIPGIELSAEYKGQDIHILGLNLDYINPQFLKQIESFRNTRNERNEKMVQSLYDHGFKNITPENILKRFGKDTVITRAHYAILMIEGGYLKNKDEAFKKYLNPGCPCYIPRTKVTVTDAVKLILLANGKPVLAHPLLYKLSANELDNLVKLLKETGLQGIEAIYSANKWNDEARMKALAKKYDLFITGGSDFHGTAKPTLELGTGYGSLKVPEELLKNIL
ncbi:MAG: PHP domain-containing protein [Lachnospiraceae bacterium]|nr:PHP domain-containing protein [Lachnospiraceae bacterium]